MRLLFAWLAICLLLLAVSGLALVGSTRNSPSLLLPFIFVLWAISVLCFTLLFFLIPMAVVPTFWAGWVRGIFGLHPKTSIGGQ